LKADNEPSFYTYTQSFTVPGSDVKAERRGLIAAGLIEEYGAGVVFRHEQTLAKPKSDRLNLLRATKAHFGHIFMLYSDAGEVDALLASQAAPDIEVVDEYQVTHRVWKVSDSEVITAVQEKMREQRLIIADGHHRYETSLNYRNERRAAAKDQGPAPYDAVMMTLVNMNSPGLVILPTHRVVHGLAAFSVEKFVEDARRLFSVEEVVPTMSASHATAVLRESGKCNTALIAVTASRAFSCIRRNPSERRSFRVLAAAASTGRGPIAQGFTRRSLGAFRGVNPKSGEPELPARHGRGNCTGAKWGQRYVPDDPCRMAQVRDIAFAGEVLPQKSTDFFPKMLDGLTIYAVD